MISGIALAAAAAMQAASPQPGIKWVPLKHANSAKPLKPAPATQAEGQSAPPTSSVVPAPNADRMAGPPPDIPSATPVTGSSADHRGLVLWRNIESGMTVSQLRALYPAGPNVSYKDNRTVLSDVPIIEGCQAKVNVMHPAGVVQEIVMRGEGSIAGRCSLKIITALSGKYGEPLDKDKVHASLFGREGKNYLWTHDGVTLQFKRYTRGVLGGGGLFAASWELRYSSAASNIDL